MNNCTFAGNVVKDGEVAAAGKSQVLRFTLAVNRPFAKEGQQDCDFIPCQIWGERAEKLAPHVLKGVKVGIMGRLQITPKQKTDGTWDHFTNVVVNEFEFLGKRADTSSVSAKPAPAQQQAAPTPTPATDGFMNIPDGIDEELPFS